MRGVKLALVLVLAIVASLLTTFAVYAYAAYHGNWAVVLRNWCIWS